MSIPDLPPAPLKWENQPSTATPFDAEVLNPWGDAVMAGAAASRDYAVEARQAAQDAQAPTDQAMANAALEPESQFSTALTEVIGGLTDTATATLIEDNASQTRGILDALVPHRNNGIIYGRDGSQYNLVAGHIRNEGDGWQYRVNPTHDTIVGPTPSCETFDDRITLNYPGMGNSKAVAFLAGPDETLAAAGITVGASVATTNAHLFLGGKVEHSGYVTYSGSGGIFNVSGTPGTSATWDGTNGRLIISHPELPSKGPDQYTMQLQVRGGGGHVVLAPGTSLSQHEFGVEFYTYAGTKITSLSQLPPFVFTHGTGGRLDPTRIDTTTFPNSNIWFIGLFERAAA